jgi:small subunit ribosomal protein S14
MKFICSRSRRYRFFFVKREIKYIIARTLWTSCELPFVIRYRFFLLLCLKQKRSSISKLRTRCILTGRARATLTKWRMSRLAFRFYVRLGLLYGVKKDSY